MSRTLRITAAALTLLLLAAGAYLWATAMIDSAFAFRSPLNAHAPTPGDPLGPPAVRRVVFVLVDALRYDTALDAEVMPALAELRSQGAAARMHSRPPSYSQAGWTVLLTGAWPEVNGGPAFNVDPEDLKPWVQDNLFTAAHRAGLQTAAAGFDWFEHMIPQETLSASFYTSGEDDAADRAVMAAALPWLDDPSLAFVLIHLDQVDYAGHHEGGPQGPNWNAAAGRVDRMLADISAKLDYTQDILVIASDHGQVNAGGHGGHDAVTLLEPLVIAGAGVRPGEYADVQMVDLAPTLAALLGTNLPAAGQGRVLTDMIDLPSETLANLSSAHPAQQAGLYAQYATAIGRRIEPVESTGAGAYPLALEQIQNARRWAERWPRLPVAVLLILLPGAALYRLRARKTGRLVALALASTALYFILYRTIDDRVFSFSSVLGPTELVLYCALAAGLAFLIPWLVLSVRDRWFKLPPAAAAERTLGFALVTAWIAAIAPIISFAWNGPVVTWALPEPSTFFIGLLGQIQVLVTGAVGLLLTAVTALISRRNWDAENHGSRGKNQDIENEAEGSLEPAD